MGRLQGESLCRGWRGDAAFTGQPEFSIRISAGPLLNLGLALRVVVRAEALLACGEAEGVCPTAARKRGFHIPGRFRTTNPRPLELVNRSGCEDLAVG